ncbi:hypothetical protein M2171_002653 [Bradyrhizobium japonicum USDA 38]|nr:hypothetical protein [Bradyrhizobium japonicum USDA 38]MCS3946034.1 hypothetical protein [Bradyrhizobium japonicum]
MAAILTAYPFGGFPSKPPRDLGRRDRIGPPRQPLPTKYSTLPKFGIGVCVAHPGSPRGAILCRHCREPGCGGRSSVGRERSGAGRIALREPETSCRMSGAARLRLVCKFPAPSTGLEKLRRHGEPCVRQNRVVLAVVATVKCFADAAVASTGAVSATFAGVREARTNSAPGRARHEPSNHRAGKAE